MTYLESNVVSVVSHNRQLLRCRTGLQFCFSVGQTSEIWMVGSEFGMNNTLPSSLISTVQADAGGVIVWGIFLCTFCAA